MMNKLFLLIYLFPSFVFSQLLYDQTLTDNGESRTSNRYTQNGDSTWVCADDFSVPAGGWNVKDVTVNGARNGIGGDMNEMIVDIYKDYNGVPDTIALYSVVHQISPMLSPISNASIMITLDSTLSLSTGVYWLSVTGTSPNNAGWEWNGVDSSYGHVAQTSLHNYIPGETLYWFPITNLNSVTFSDLSFKIGHDPLGFEKQEQVELNLYPNPVGNELTLIGTSLTNIISVEIYKMDGQLVKTTVTSFNQLLDVSELPAGLYVINVNCDTGSFSKLFLKK